MCLEPSCVVKVQAHVPVNSSVNVGGKSYVLKKKKEIFLSLVSKTEKQLSLGEKIAYV